MKRFYKSFFFYFLYDSTHILKYYLSIRIFFFRTRRFIAFFYMSIMIKIFKIYDCDAKHFIIDKICDKNFTRSFNLKKHYRNFHTFHNKNIFTTTFIIFDFISRQRTTYHYAFMTQIFKLFFHFFEWSVFYTNFFLTFFETRKTICDFSRNQTIDFINFFIKLLENVNDQQIFESFKFFDNHIFESKKSIDIEIDKRKRFMTFCAYDRIEKTRLLFKISKYVIKRFKIYIDQMFALNWFSDFVRNEFQIYHKNFMTQLTNFKVNHIDICVFYSENWKIIELIIIAKRFNYEMTSLISIERSMYRFFDHTISLTRVITWFEIWFRKKRNFDNFIECDIDNSMNEFHIRHQFLCIIHSCYESFDINQNRKNCYKFVLFLRQQNQIVFKNCDKHNSSCQMQINCFFSNFISIDWLS